MNRRGVTGSRGGVKRCFGRDAGPGGAAPQRASVARCGAAGDPGPAGPTRDGRSSLGRAPTGPGTPRRAEWTTTDTCRWPPRREGRGMSRPRRCATYGAGVRRSPSCRSPGSSRVRSGTGPVAGRSRLAPSSGAIRPVRTRSPENSRGRRPATFPETGAVKRASRGPRSRLGVAGARGGRRWSAGGRAAGPAPARSRHGAAGAGLPTAGRCGDVAVSSVTAPEGRERP